jgi:hypothetical protein
MTRVLRTLIALMWIVPGAALAHGPGEHAADPGLHVGNEYGECYVKFASNLTQDAFRRFAREFGSVSAFKLMAPPGPLGRGRVAVAVEALAFTIEEKSAAWNDTFHHPDAYHELGSDKQFPMARVRVGVADDLELGAFYTKAPSSNYGWLGLEAKYGLLRQGEATPVSLSVRGAYTKTLFVEDMDMHALTADVAAGRTLWNVLTPYVALGADAIYVRETSDAVDLRSEALVVPHATGGVELRYWHLALAAEGRLSAVHNFQVQVAAIF